MRPAFWVALVAAVWSVYTADHLADARRAGPRASERHRFHREQAATLRAVLALVVLGGALAASQLRPPVRAFGLALSFAVGAYLLSAQGLVLPKLPKELAAGLLYAAGIWGGPLLMAARPWAWPFAAALLHATAAVTNLMALGVFEQWVDRELGARSLALRWGASVVRRTVILGGGAATLLALALWIEAPAPSRAAFAVIALELAAPVVMLGAERWFARAERYRTWGDAVFLLGAMPRLLA